MAHLLPSAAQFALNKNFSVKTQLSGALLLAYSDLDDTTDLQTYSNLF